MERRSHSGAENAGNTIPKARLDKEIEKRKAVETGLGGLIADLTEDVPEDYRGMIPGSSGWRVLLTEKRTWSTIR